VTQEQFDTQTGANRDPDFDRNWHDEEHEAAVQRLAAYNRRRDALEAINVERERQIMRWGVQEHPDGTHETTWIAAAESAKRTNDWLGSLESGELTWLDILLEEVYEAACETNAQRLETELIQVAAVCTAWVEDIRRRG
jgi:hypothetical protein